MRVAALDKLPPNIMPFALELKAVAALGAAVLKGPWPQVAPMPAANLWKDDRPTVVYAIRRMG